MLYYRQYTPNHIDIPYIAGKSDGYGVFPVNLREDKILTVVYREVDRLNAIGVFTAA